MNFRLVDSGWDKVLREAVSQQCAGVRIVCPFIKHGAAKRLLARGSPKPFQVITRFCLRDFCDGVSDISALRLLLELGAQIRGVRNLHAKLYLFDEKRVVVTSANLTDAALLRNHEFGFVAEDPEIVVPCREYFENLWCRAGADLRATQLTDWEGQVTRYLAAGAPPGAATPMGDEGVDAGIPPAFLTATAWVGEAAQSFVKFFGQSGDRASRSMAILDEVRSSCSHRACSYPSGKRPRQVQDGALMFMSRLANEPDDILIYGRAVGMHHEPGRDDATPYDIALRPWRNKWRHYVPVHDAEFIAGRLGNGVSLNELMETLKADAFSSTQRHAQNGAGNTDPRRAYMRQASVELSAQGRTWLNERLERAFAQCGRIPRDELNQLDWPSVTLP